MYVQITANRNSKVLKGQSSFIEVILNSIRKAITNLNIENVIIDECQDYKTVLNTDIEKEFNRKVLKTIKMLSPEVTKNDFNINIFTKNEEDKIIPLPTTEGSTTSLHKERFLSRSNSKKKTVN